MRQRDECHKSPIRCRSSQIPVDGDVSQESWLYRAIKLRGSCCLSTSVRLTPPINSGAYEGCVMFAARASCLAFSIRSDATNVSTIMGPVYICFRWISRGFISRSRVAGSLAPNGSSGRRSRQPLATRGLAAELEYDYFSADVFAMKGFDNRAGPHGRLGVSSADTQLGGRENRLNPWLLAVSSQY